MKTASTDNSVTISWDPPEPSDGYTSVTYTLRYGVLDTPGEVINTQNTQETINSLGNDIMRVIVKCSYDVLFHIYFLSTCYRTRNTILHYCISWDYWWKWKGRIPYFLYKGTRFLISYE